MGSQRINILYYLWSKTGFIRACYWPVSYPQRFISLKPDKNDHFTVQTDQGFDFIGNASLRSAFPIIYLSLMLSCNIVTILQQLSQHLKTSSGLKTKKFKIQEF